MFKRAARKACSTKVRPDPTQNPALSLSLKPVVPMMSFALSPPLSRLRLLVRLERSSSRLGSAGAVHVVSFFRLLALGKEPGKARGRHVTQALERLGSKITGPECSTSMRTAS